MDTLFSKESVIPSLNVLIVMSTYGGLLSFIALYGKEVGVHNTSLFFLIFSIGIAVSRLTAGKAFDRNGPENYHHLFIDTDSKFSNSSIGSECSRVFPIGHFYWIRDRCYFPNLPIDGE
jgi:hypothetical protein